MTVMNSNQEFNRLLERNKYVNVNHFPGIEYNNAFIKAIELDSTDAIKHIANYVNIDEVFSDCIENNSAYAYEYIHNNYSLSDDNMFLYHYVKGQFTYCMSANHSKLKLINKLRLCVLYRKYMKKIHDIEHNLLCYLKANTHILYELLRMLLNRMEYEPIIYIVRTMHKDIDINHILNMVVQYRCTNKELLKLLIHSSSSSQQQRVMRMLTRNQNSYSKMVLAMM